MGIRRLILVPFVLAWSVRVAHADDRPKALSDDDKKLLEGLIREFLIDPQGAQRVVVTRTVRTVWAEQEEVSDEGWLVAGNNGPVVLFADGASMPAPPEPKRRTVDFRKACRARYDAMDKPAEKEGVDREDAWRRMRLTALGAFDDDLALAAWLHRLGDDELAVRALAAARAREGDPIKRLRDGLVWSAFAATVHAFMVRADDEALSRGERLLRLHPAEAKDLPQAAAIVEDLRRRRANGNFGKTPADKLPDGFDKWDAARKAAHWIDALDEVDARQWGQPGGIDLGSDSRVEALIRLGDPAVPALLDVLENDRRLTRSVHFWRDFARSRTVLEVREAALTALMSILRVRVFEPVATGDSFTARGDDARVETVARLRAYWKKYGALPFDERMMKILTDPKATFAAKREAAENLSTLGTASRLQTTISPVVIGADPPRKRNPAVEKFSAPTVAEAVLATLDADLAAHDAKPGEDRRQHDYQRNNIENHYLRALVELGDARIAPKLVDRADRAKAVPARRKWAGAAHDLGSPQPLRAFISEFQAGKFAFSDDRDDDELANVVRVLVLAGTPEAELALNSLTDPKHPQHKAVALKVRSSRGDFDRGPWLRHPFCLTLLRASLDDTTPTGQTMEILDGQLLTKSEDSAGVQGVPAFLADPAVRRERAVERVCDSAAETFGRLVIGLPAYHPLFKDADARLAALKAVYDRFAGKFRPADGRERRLFNLWEAAFLPDVRPLERAATAEDVKAGRALFHLEGRGKPSGLKLPAVARSARAADKTRRPDVLILQAEIGPDGRTTYGVIRRHEIRTATADELTDILSFEDLARQEQEAAAKIKGGKD